MPSGPGDCSKSNGSVTYRVEDICRHLLIHPLFARDKKIAARAFGKVVRTPFPSEGAKLADFPPSCRNNNTAKREVKYG